MDRFTIKADLLSPAIISTLTLDGLLGAVLFDELKSGKLVWLLKYR